jgi:hypothetical protein
MHIVSILNTIPMQIGLQPYQSSIHVTVHPVIIWWWNSSSHTIQQNQTQILYKQLEWVTTLQQQTALVGLFRPIFMGQKCVSYQGPKRGFACQCAIYFLCTPASLWRFNDLPPSFSSLDLDHDNNFSSMVKNSHCYYSHLGHWPRLSVLVSNYGHLELLTFLETCWILRYSMMTSEMLVTTFMEGKQLSCACIRNVLPFIHP